ncbi:LysR family transcriptional regulator [Pseudomonas sp. 1912-s]|uniref:LysR family transcriptional regulator n=1 Tax=Pseudomonas sp. 1912-s TaxID=3033802 RepID=UPI0023DF72D7|nr:LysR family transcriptional regulator [Pseudomonas sp. 1912-s]MDF3202707.1 LysR family transcriptional regulator [Pseudomonas sp. 1912-s]
MNQRLPIDVLRALQTVVETGSVTRAAERLNLSQSAVSWKIKRLEKQLERPLIQRDGQRLVASDDGAQLLIHARRILEAHDAALAHFNPVQLHGTIRLGATEQVPMAELSNLLGQFSRQHRQLDVRIVVEQSHVLRQALVDRELDLALHQDFTHRVEARDQLLWSENVHWCTRPGWQHAPDDCVRLITFGPGCFYRQLAQERLSALGIPWQVAVECGSVEGVVSAIAAGLGVGLLSSDHLDKRVVVHRPFEQQMALPEVANVLRFAEDSPEPRLQALQQLLVQALHRG